MFSWWTVHVILLLNLDLSVFINVAPLNRGHIYEAAAEGVQRNTANIAENTEKVAKAEATTSAIESIQAQLTKGVTAPAGIGRVREKRQANNPSASMNQVAKPTECTSFTATFKEILDLAAAVTDVNI